MHYSKAEGDKDLAKANKPHRDELSYGSHRKEAKSKALGKKKYKLGDTTHKLQEEDFKKGRFSSNEYQKNIGRG
jgi:hypothetical protein